jgi:hypothetical protein
MALQITYNKYFFGYLKVLKAHFHYIENFIKQEGFREQKKIFCYEKTADVVQISMKCQYSSIKDL